MNIKNSLNKKQLSYLESDEGDYIVTENINLVKSLRARGMKCPMIKNRYNYGYGKREKCVGIIAISEDVSALIKEYLMIKEPGEIEIIHGSLIETREGCVIDSTYQTLNKSVFN